LFFLEAYRQSLRVAASKPQYGTLRSRPSRKKIMEDGTREKFVHPHLVDAFSLPSKSTTMETETETSYDVKTSMLCLFVIILFVLFVYFVRLLFILFVDDGTTKKIVHLI
jgi:hypothetical protein